MLAKLIFAETTTLGVRLREDRRLTLERRWVPARTPWGEVRIKVASLNGTLANYAPEYEDCRRLAAEHAVPLKSVMQEAMKAYLEQPERGRGAAGRKNVLSGKAPEDRTAKNNTAKKRKHPKQGAKR
jgi:hypothetical protein